MAAKDKPTQKCKLCGGTKEVLETKARQMGYTGGLGESEKVFKGDIADEKLIPCSLCASQLASKELTEELAIALFEKEIEKGQQWAEEDGLGKIGMMPHKTKWEELAKKDKGYWVERAEELRVILRTLNWLSPQEVKDKVKQTRREVGEWLESKLVATPLKGAEWHIQLSDVDILKAGKLPKSLKGGTE